MSFRNEVVDFTTMYKAWNNPQDKYAEEMYKKQRRSNQRDREVDDAAQKEIDAENARRTQQGQPKIQTVASTGTPGTNTSPAVTSVDSSGFATGTTAGPVALNTEMPQFKFRRGGRVGRYERGGSAATYGGSPDPAELLHDEAVGQPTQRYDPLAANVNRTAAAPDFADQNDLIVRQLLKDDPAGTPASISKAVGPPQDQALDPGLQYQSEAKEMARQQFAKVPPSQEPLPDVNRDLKKPPEARTSMVGRAFEPIIRRATAVGGEILSDLTRSDINPTGYQSPVYGTGDPDNAFPDYNKDPELYQRIIRQRDIDRERVGPTTAVGPEEEARRAAAVEEARTRLDRPVPQPGTPAYQQPYTGPRNEPAAPPNAPPTTQAPPGAPAPAAPAAPAAARPNIAGMPAGPGGEPQPPARPPVTPADPRTLDYRAFDERATPPVPGTPGYPAKPVTPTGPGQGNGQPKAPPPGAGGANAPSTAVKTDAPGPGGTRVAKGSLGDQTRTAAFDPSGQTVASDPTDPRNIGSVDQAGVDVRGSGVSPADLRQTITGAMSVAPANGAHVVGNGAVQRDTYRSFVAAHNQGGKLTPGQAMLVGMVGRYKALLSQGRQEEAAKMAWGLIQAANIEAASFGKVALDQLRAGDPRATQSLADAADYLPDGRDHRASADGRSIETYDENGKLVGRVQMDGRMALQLALGLSNGSLMWEALQTTVASMKTPDKNAEGRALDNEYKRRRLAKMDEPRGGRGGARVPVPESDRASSLDAKLGVRPPSTRVPGLPQGSNDGGDNSTWPTVRDDD